MEKAIDRHLEQMSKIPGVTSIVCTDKHGLTLSAKGELAPQCGGLVTSIAQKVNKLHPDSGVVPVVVMETDNTSVVIKEHEDITLAVFRTT